MSFVLEPSISQIDLFRFINWYVKCKKIKMHLQFFFYYLKSSCLGYLQCMWSIRPHWFVHYIPSCPPHSLHHQHRPHPQSWCYSWRRTSQSASIYIPLLSHISGNNLPILWYLSESALLEVIQFSSQSSGIPQIQLQNKNFIEINTITRPTFDDSQFC